MEKLPEGWEKVSIEKDSILISGLRPIGGALDEGIPSLGGEHIMSDGRIDFSDENSRYIPEDFFRLMTKGKAKEKDILINKDGANTGKVAILKRKFSKDIAINEHLFILRSRNFFDHKYLFYWLLSYYGQKQIKERITGSAQPGLSSSFTKNFFILKPPLPEQCKIAEILEAVDNVIEKTVRIIEKYKRIKQGLMQDLLTRGIDENGQIRREETHKFKDSPLGRIPEKWGVVKFEEIGELTSSKRVYFNEYTEDGIPFYRSKEIIEKTKGLDIENALFIPESKYKLIKKNYGVPKAGDVLITAVGTLGIIYVVEDTDGDFYFKDGNLLWLKGLNQLFIDIRFLFYIFRFAFEKQKEDMIIGSSQNALTIEKMKNLLIFYPPLSEQRRIASILSQIDETIEKEQEYKGKLERIKQGLMEDLLIGKVRVNNLIDEAKYVSQT